MHSSWIQSCCIRCLAFPTAHATDFNLWFHKTVPWIRLRSTPSSSSSGHPGASIPWGDEAEIFIIAILGGRKFVLVHSTLAQFLSLHWKRRNVYMMKVLCRPTQHFFFPPGKAKFHVIKITSYPHPHRKAKLPCTKIYFFPLERLSFMYLKLLLPPWKAKFHVIKLISYP